MQRTLPQGSTLSRYVVTGTLGAGGNGTVYAAHDPRLDRKVAIKLLHQLDDPQEGRSRLQREAQIMAQLSHPNVIAVYDVGSFGDEVFVAMEHLEGGTLRDWLRERPRGWHEILGAFAPAGRGLEAAHAAGIVHRDFKPDNVLCGKDGRVVVTDFGVARSSGDISLRAAAAAIDLKLALLDTLSDAGVIAGTPQYMAPEQLLGKAADQRSDQFSFCVTLYEALYGVLPFAAKTYAEHIEQIHAGRLEPSSAAVPGWLRKIVVRGLAGDPAARHWSMAALVAALERGPLVTWPRAGAGVAAVGLAVIAAIAWPRKGELCKGAAGQLAGVWDPARKQAARAAFAATGSPRAELVFSSTAAALDAYAADWTSMRVAACEATRVHGEQPEEVLDLRMTCLDQRLAALRAVSDLVVTVDARGLDRAPPAAAGLPLLGGCADVKVLQARGKPPTDPALRTQIAALRADVAQVSALISFGRVAEAVEKGAPTAAAARALGYRPLEAETLYLYGRALDVAGRVDDAEKALADAVYAAQGAREDGIAVQALVYLAHVVGNEQQKYAEAEAYLQQAAALVEARPLPELEAHLANARGNLAGAQGKFDQAYDQHKRALEIWIPMLGKDNPRLAPVHANFSMDARRRGDLDEALASILEAKRLWEAAYGPDYGGLVGVEGGISGIYKVQKDFARAEEHALRGLAIAEKSFGAEHPVVVDQLIGLGSLYDDFGHYPQAHDFYSRALAVSEKVNGADALDTGQTMSDLGNVLQKQGKLGEARALYGRALAILEKRLGPESGKLAVVVNNLASAELALGNPRVALPLCERAERLYDKKFGRPINYAEIQLTMAQTLWALGKDKPRALELARAARKTYAEWAPPAALAEVDAWLKSKE